MVNYNTAFYGDSYNRPYTDTATANVIGQLVPYNAGAYYDAPAQKGKPLDESIYLWKVGKNGTFASTSAWCVDTGNTFHMEIKSNDVLESPKLAMAAVNVDSNSSQSKYVTAPNHRAAYDISETAARMNYTYTALFYDIVYSCYCLESQVRCINYTGGGSVVARNIDPNGTATTSLRPYIDADPDNRDVVMIAPYIYKGTKTSRNNSILYPPLPKDGGSNYRTYTIPALLKDLPIPDNANAAKYMIADNDPDRITDRVYLPFTMRFNSAFYASTNTDSSDQLTIGFHYSNTFANFRTGIGYPSSQAGRINGGFCRYSENLQKFDDVEYHWECGAYDQTNHEFLEEEDDIGSKTGNLRIMSYLVIDDMKDALTKGEALERAVKHELAFIGFYFADTVTLAQTGVLGADGDGIGIYLPEIVKGATTGKYFTGADIANVPYADAESSEAFDDGGGGDDDYSRYENSTPSLSNQHITLNTLNVYSLVNLQSLLSDINSIPSRIQQGDIDDYSSQYYFFGADPYDYIIGYYMIPSMFISKAFTDNMDSSIEYISIGKYTSQVQANKIKLSTPVRRLFIDEVLIPRFFKSFLDYEPYTSLSLYLPYYGTISLAPSIFIGHHLSVYSSLDFLSGNLSYLIYADGVQITTVTTNVKYDIPINGQDISSYSELISQNAHSINMLGWETMQQISNIVARTGTGIAISAKQKNKMGMVTGGIGGIMNLIATVGAASEQRDYLGSKTEKMTPLPLTISSGSVPDGLGNILQPFITINRPRFPANFDIDEFSNINGKACYQIDKIKNFNGFTVIENPILDNLAISQKEKELLRAILADGIILPEKE